MMKKIKDIERSGFGIPEHYMEGVEDAVFARIAEEKIRSLVSNPGFTVPDGYLNSLEDKVVTKIKDEPKVISMFSRRNLYYISGVAASIILIFGIFTFTGGSKDEEALDPMLVEQYLIDQDIDTYDLASLLTEEDIEQMDLDIMESAFEDDSLEDYLLENVNLEEIIDQ